MGKGWTDVPGKEILLSNAGMGNIFCFLGKALSPLGNECAYCGQPPNPRKKGKGWTDVPGKEILLSNAGMGNISCFLAQALSPLGNEGAYCG
jgi:hypothetical protein